MTYRRAVSSETRPSGRGGPLLPVAAGTALVLITYVTPLATAPQTVATLGAGPSARAWILSSMSVGLAAALLASGAVGDALGRRRAYVAGLVLTAAGSLGCFVAQEPLTFVIGRLVQGVGGAAVLACGLAILVHAAAGPPARAHATGVWGASVGVGITGGALLAAVLGGSWRVDYAVVGVLALLLVWPSLTRLPETSAVTARRLDVVGLVVLAGALTAVVSALTEARTGFGVGPAAIAVLAALLFALFAVVERRTAEPLIDLTLLRSPDFAGTTVGALALGGGMIALTSGVPSYVQDVLGGDLRTSALLIAGWSGVSVVTSLLIRRVTVTAHGAVQISVLLVMVAAGQVLALWADDDRSPWRILPAMLVAGIATGALNTILGREAVASVPPDRAAMGSGSNQTARYLGAACGITAFSLIAAHSGWHAAVLTAMTVTIVGAVLTGLIGWRATTVR